MVPSHGIGHIGYGQRDMIDSFQLWQCQLSPSSVETPRGIESVLAGPVDADPIPVGVPEVRLLATADGQA